MFFAFKNSFFCVIIIVREKGKALEQFNDFIRTNNSIITKARAKDYSSLSFAFIGDGVHTLFIRTMLTSSSTAQAGKLHNLTNEYVKASAQAFVLEGLVDSLTEEEKDIARRARNVKNKTVAKNALLEDYKKATGFEAIIGYLYLIGQNDRMIELLNLSIKIMEKK